MRIGAVTLDCNDLQELTEFYRQLTGRTLKPTKLDEYEVLVDGDGGPHLILQKVPEGRSGKNRAHIDFHVPEIEAEAQRAVGLGATYVKKYHGDEGWIWMHDPEGNEFCICKE